MVIFYVLWNYAGMAKKPATGIASRLDAMLGRIKPDDMSERGWLLAAQVNTSFFTDLRKGTVPSIDKVERLARAAGLSLAEFVSDGERVGVSASHLHKAIQEALPLPPFPPERQAAYLADIVLDILGLPTTQRPIAANDATRAADDNATSAPPLGSTTRT